MSGERLNIRSFAPADQDAVRRLVMSGLAEHFDYLDPSMNPDLSDIETTYLSSGNIFLVAEMKAQIIATGALVLEAPETGRIVRVSVAPEKRRMGIGKNVVHHLLDKAQEMNLKCVLVETNLDWVEALAFYQDLGFSEYSRDIESIHMSLQL